MNFFSKNEPKSMDWGELPLFLFYLYIGYAIIQMFCGNQIRRKKTIKKTIMDTIVGL